MEDSSLPCFNTSETSTFWGSGNNDQTPTLCTQGREGENHYAILQSISKFVLAAGNLFSGTFKYTSAGLGGTGAVNFGQKYFFETRPTALQVKYRAKVEPVDLNILKGPLEKTPKIKHVFLLRLSIGRHSTRFHLHMFSLDQTMAVLGHGIQKLQKIPGKDRLSVMAHFGSPKRLLPQIGKMPKSRSSGTTKLPNQQMGIIRL